MVGVTKIMVSMFSLCDSLEKKSGQGGGRRRGGSFLGARVYIHRIGIIMVRGSIQSNMIR